MSDNLTTKNNISIWELENHTNEDNISQELSNITLSEKKPYYKKKPNYDNQHCIISYGIILYTFFEDQPYFLLYQRRDTFEYVDFLRGIWNSEKELYPIFSRMTLEERARLKNYGFDRLWDDLWVTHSCKAYKDGYKKASKRFNEVKHKINDILNNTISFINETNWEFPKGKKNNFKEEPIKCALREFSEETKIPKENIEIKSYEPFIENFYGSNGKMYSTYYYIAYSSEKKLPEEVKTPQCIRETTISEEASKIDWFSYKDACNKLNPRRQAILKSIYLDIINLSN